ncbi:MAG TPA: glucose 1-dehydrogenase [Solirubrobacteraceae bacterium]|nr:glucose 1-dehydrogenase [Solirubrobacteraceae bacterium]
MDRVALVTGGGTGIGRATALGLAASGAAVVVTGRRREPVEEVAAEVGGLAVAGDMSVPEDARRVVDEAVRVYGALHVVVNNAGSIRRNQRLHEVGVERWDEQIASNLRGPYLVLHAALPELLRSDGDRAIVNVSSTLAVKPVSGTAPYAAAKGALIALTKTLAVEYGGDGIRCNAVLPAVVRTALARVDRPDYDEREGAMAAAYPVGRLGEPEDVARAIVWLASPEAGWVTGTAVTVDGGFTST